MSRERHSVALLGASAVPALVVVWSIDPLTPWLTLVPLIAVMWGFAPNVLSIPTRAGLATLAVAIAATGIASVLYAAPHGRIFAEWGLITVSDGSFAVAGASMSRMLAIALPALLVSRGISAHELLATLAVKRVVPARVALATLIALRLIPVIASDLEETRQARRANGHGQSPFAIALTALVVAIRRAVRMSDVAESRGFSKQHRVWSSYNTMRFGDWTLVVLAVAIGVGALVITATTGNWNSAIA
jgi:energy-coupling factor transporter transmembrane protein EcfT